MSSLSQQERLERLQRKEAELREREAQLKKEAVAFDDNKPDRKSVV